MNKYKFDIDHYLELALKGEKLEEVAIEVICAKLREILCLE
jgi:hypothetical protein